MNAPTAAEVAKGLRELADGTEITGLVPSQHWPLVYRVPGDGSPARVLAVARRLGVQDGEPETLTDEEGLLWYRLRGHVGGVPVEVTAESAPVLSIPEPGGRIVAMEPVGEAAL